MYGDETYPVTNPASGSTIANVSKAGRDETQSAIEGAQTAFRSWRRKTAKERSKIVRRWGELMLENQHDLATILTTEQGKPFTEALGEVAYAAGFLEWFAEEAKRIYGDVIPSHKANLAYLGHKGTHWCGWCYHALELPIGDDHSEGGSCDCRRLQHGIEAFRGNPAFCSGIGNTGRGGGCTRRRLQCGVWRCTCHRWCHYGRQGRTQTIFHRLYTGWKVTNASSG